MLVTDPPCFPDPPTLGIGGTGSTSITVNITPPANSGTCTITSYTVQCSTASDFSSGLTIHTGVTGSTNIFSGLASSTLYYFRAETICPAGAGNSGANSSSEWSATVSATTSAVAGPPSPLHIPIAGVTSNADAGGCSDCEALNGSWPVVNQQSNTAYHPWWRSADPGILSTFCPEIRDSWPDPTVNLYWFIWIDADSDYAEVPGIWHITLFQGNDISLLWSPSLSPSRTIAGWTASYNGTTGAMGFNANTGVGTFSFNYATGTPYCLNWPATITLSGS